MHTTTRRALPATAFAAIALALAACGTGTPSNPTQAKADTGHSASAEAAGALTTTATGYGINRSNDPTLPDYVWTASTVHNGTRNVAMFTASFSVYGTDGTVAGQGTATGILGANGTGAGGTQVEIPHASAVSKVVVTLSTADSRVDTHPDRVFTTTGVHYQPDQYTAGKVLGEVKSNFPQDVTQVQVEAVCFDGKGHIIGGGETYVDAIGAGQTVGFSADLMAVSGKPAKCAAYPMVSALSQSS